MSFLTLWYRFLYWSGITPWEVDPSQGIAANQIAELFKREEEYHDPPFGPVLDLGCGSGIWSVELAKRGWQVIGVDVVPKAIRRARKRAKEAGVHVRFVESDVTALSDVVVGSDFRFVVDFECFNHLNDKQRLAVGRAVNKVTVPNARMLMLAWEPGKRRLLPQGASPGDIETAFPGWKISGEDLFAAQSELPGWMNNTPIHFYRLQKENVNLDDQHQNESDEDRIDSQIKIET